jgi:uncharacterized protein YybS (DUF2232 family)
MEKSDVLGCVGCTAIIFFISAWIPLLGPLLRLLAPLPFLFYATKLGPQEGLKLAAIAIGIIGGIASLAGHPQFILLGIELSALGLVLSELFRRNLGVGQTILLGTAFMILLSLGYLFVIGLSRGMGPLELLLDYLHGQVKAAVDAYKEMGAPIEDVSELEAYAKVFIETIYPALIIVGIGFSVWLNVVVSRPVFRMGNLRYPEFGPMDHWRAPDAMIWGVIASGFGLFLFSGSLKSLAANTLLVLMIVYLFQGLSIVLFFFNKYHLPPWVRVGIYLLLFVQQVFMLILAVAGLFDQWLDVRKIRNTGKG